MGDPLSPFRFVIIGETLSRMVLASAGVGLIGSFKVAFEILLGSHLQFANDSLLFCEALEAWNEKSASL